MKALRGVGIIVLLALLACKTGGASGEKEPSKGNGAIEVKEEQENTTFKVGTAYAIPSKWEDGQHYTFWIYNDGVKDPPCTTELFPDKPVGGNDWAVTIEMSPIGDPVRPTDKNKIYKSAMVRVYYVASSGDYKGSVFNGISSTDLDRSHLTIVSIDGDTITAKIEALGKGEHVKGEFKAKICTPK